MAPPIHPTTQALLNLLLPMKNRQTTDLTERAYTTIQTLHDLIRDVQLHAATIERARRAADAAEESPMVFALFERVKQKDGALNRIVTNLAKEADYLTDTLYQMDQMALDMRRSIDTRDERE